MHKVPYIIQLMFSSDSFLITRNKWEAKVYLKYCVLVSNLQVESSLRARGRILNKLDFHKMKDLEEVNKYGYYDTLTIFQVAGSLKIQKNEMTYLLTRE